MSILGRQNSHKSFIFRFEHLEFRAAKFMSTHPVSHQFLNRKASVPRVTVRQALKEASPKEVVKVPSAVACFSEISENDENEFSHRRKWKKNAFVATALKEMRPWMD